jgi:hypothetical protein
MRKNRRSKATVRSRYSHVSESKMSLSSPDVKRQRLKKDVGLESAVGDHKTKGCSCVAYFAPEGALLNALRHYRGPQFDDSSVPREQQASHGLRTLPAKQQF